MSEVIGDSPEEREAALVEADRRATSDTENFDAFWAAVEHKPVRLNNVFGVDVVLEPGLPLKFQVESERLKDEQSEESLHKIIAIVFGEGTLDTWIERGVTHEQLMVLLMWGISNRKSPGSMSLARARDLHLQHAADQGKAEAAPATRTRATTSGAASGSTGSRSKRTSAASTGSRRKTSRT